MGGIGGATGCRTVQRKSIASAIQDLDLATGKNSLANDANPLVVERIPAPFSIDLLQESKAFFGSEVRFHANSGTERVRPAYRWQV